MALRERKFEILDILIDLTQNMVEGELLQLTRLGRIDLTEAEATELAYRKTACLFSGCARLGAVLGKQPKDMEEALAWNTASNAEPCLSIWSTICSILPRRLNELGKPVLSDLKEGEGHAAADFRARSGWRSPGNRWRWKRAFARGRAPAGGESSGGAGFRQRYGRKKLQS